MVKDPQLEKLYTEFATLDDREKEYILGVSQALAFSLKYKTEKPQAESEKPMQGTEL
jgi:hypothetical protein